MPVRCISPYKATRMAFAPGDIVSDPEQAAFVLRDSPGSFEVIPDESPPLEAESKAIEKPPVDKAIKPKRDQAMTKADHRGLTRD